MLTQTGRDSPASRCTYCEYWARRLMDTAMLLAALDNGHISAPGFDVYECEPDLPDGFADRWDITVLPHIGYATTETLTEAENGVMRNIEDVLDRGCGITPINKIE
ncbi:hypothetical protein V1515DRAFT_593157 [Lipomyces mesembrius]